MIRAALRSLPLLALALASTVGADSDRWYAVDIGGMPCGWTYERVERDLDLVRTIREERVVIARGGAAGPDHAADHLRGVPRRSTAPGGDRHRCRR